MMIQYEKRGSKSSRFLIEFCFPEHKGETTYKVEIPRSLLILIEFYLPRGSVMMSKQESTECKELGRFVLHPYLNRVIDN